MTRDRNLAPSEGASLPSSDNQLVRIRWRILYSLLAADANRYRMVRSIIAVPAFCAGLMTGIDPRIASLFGSYAAMWNGLFPNALSEESKAWVAAVSGVVGTFLLAARIAADYGLAGHVDASGAAAAASVLALTAARLTGMWTDPVRRT